MDAVPTSLVWKLPSPGFALSARFPVLSVLLPYEFQLVAGSFLLLLRVVFSSTVVSGCASAIFSVLFGAINTVVNICLAFIFVLVVQINYFIEVSGLFQANTSFESDMYSKKLRRSGQFAKIRRVNQTNFEREMQALMDPSPGPSVVPTSIEEDFGMPEGIDSDTQLLEDDEDVESIPSTNTDAESDTEEESENDFQKPFETLLRLWALSCKVPLTTLTKLLKLLSHKTDFNLPKDAKTFLKTPILIGNQIENVAGGQLWYRGVEKTLKQYFCQVTPATSLININLSMDGLPLHNSGPTQLWPILMTLPDFDPMPVLVVAIFCGASKPENAEGYLRQLVDELNHLSDQGTIINGKMIDIQLRAIIADTPARSFLKGVAYHNAVHGCIKCKSLGTFIKSARKVVYKSVQGEPRTDKELKGGVYKEHVKRTSPLFYLNYFDLIVGFIIADLLHLIDIGVFRKLIQGFVTGALKPFPKWSPEQQSQVHVLKNPCLLEYLMHHAFCFLCLVL
ncbi:uncharacterized protein LOC120905714 [Anopheles arabiensis]|uniref:uncharacterized protein LOC120905714 n=1 Tax=Anopheles arabiensis TaxID=7173 RepID=UPI001AAE000D|nr:uncharacterized protein LOC120905714 [Anopheles arabiensis]